LQKVVTQNDPNPLHVCSFNFSENRCRLQLFDGREIASLNNKDFCNLKDLHKNFNVSLQGILLPEQLSVTDDSPLTTVWANIYGNRTIANDVGDALSAYSYFLQDPYWIPHHVSYENPQYLELPEPEFSHEGLDGHIAESLRNTESRSQPKTYINDYGIDFDRVLDDFARHEYLIQATVDDRISTQMLR
jgi:hypothetical protein